MTDAPIPNTDDSLQRLGSRIQIAASAVGMILFTFVLMRCLQVLRFPEYFNIGDDRFFFKAESLSRAFSGDVLIGLLVAAFAMHIGGWLTGKGGDSGLGLLGRLSIVTAGALVAFMSLYSGGYLLTHIDEFGDTVSSGDNEFIIEEGVVSLLRCLLALVAVGLAVVQTVRVSGERRVLWASATGRPADVPTSTALPAQALDTEDMTVASAAGVDIVFGESDPGDTALGADESSDSTPTQALSFDPDGSDAKSDAAKPEDARADKVGHEDLGNARQDIDNPDDSRAGNPDSDDAVQDADSEGALEASASTEKSGGERDLEDDSA
ncbi:MAG: hypothetical protein H6512_11100 [Acidimicrobiia bacterium]|nr:hypothetical protein [Acidimicrobiia bacterium]